MSTINFKIDNIANVKSPRIKADNRFAIIPSAIFSITDAIIIMTLSTSTNESLRMNNIQNFLYLSRNFKRDSLVDVCVSIFFVNLSGTIKITPKAIAKKMLKVVSISFDIPSALTEKV